MGGGYLVSPRVEASLEWVITQGSLGLDWVQDLLGWQVACWGGGRRGEG